MLVRLTLHTLLAAVLVAGAAFAWQASSEGPSAVAANFAEVLARLRRLFMTASATPPRPRPPSPAETGFLLLFHAVLSGAFLVAYLTGDEDTYGMHLFAGYTVLAARRHARAFRPGRAWVLRPGTASAYRAQNRDAPLPDSGAGRWLSHAASSPYRPHSAGSPALRNRSSRWWRRRSIGSRPCAVDKPRRLGRIFGAPKASTLGRHRRPSPPVLVALSALKQPVPLRHSYPQHRGRPELGWNRSQTHVPEVRTPYGLRRLPPPRVANTSRDLGRAAARPTLAIAECNSSCHRRFGKLPDSSRGGDLWRCTNSP